MHDSCFGKPTDSIRFIYARIFLSYRLFLKPLHTAAGGIQHSVAKECPCSATKRVRKLTLDEKIKLSYLSIR